MRLVDIQNVTLDYSGLRKIGPHNYLEICRYFANQIMELPTINPDDLVKHGEWIYWEGWRGNYDCRIDGARCSLCGYSHETVYNVTNPKESLSNYCPNCGAKMDGGKENE